jgi:hypothetical protein
MTVLDSQTFDRDRRFVAGSRELLTRAFAELRRKRIDLTNSGTRHIPSEAHDV